MYIYMYKNMTHNATRGEGDIKTHTGRREGRKEEEKKTIKK